jgi:hypothetical protein
LDVKPTIVCEIGYDFYISLKVTDILFNPTITERWRTRKMQFK